MECWTLGRFSNSNCMCMKVLFMPLKIPANSGDKGVVPLLVGRVVET